MKKNNKKEEIIIDIIKLLQQEGLKVQENIMPIEDQLLCLDVIVNSIRFLRNYDENIKILDKYYKNKNDDKIR